MCDAGIVTKESGGFFIDLYLTMTKQSKAFNWKGAQGELVRMMIAETRFHQTQQRLNTRQSMMPLKGMF